MASTEKNSQVRPGVIIEYTSSIAGVQETAFSDVATRHGVDFPFPEFDLFETDNFVADEEYISEASYEHYAKLYDAFLR